MSPYTYLQLVELVLFAGVLAYGELTHRGELVMLAGGLLIGKALLNILRPEGGSLYRRSLIGYLVGAAFFVTGTAAIRLGG